MGYFKQKTKVFDSFFQVKMHQKQLEDKENELLKALSNLNESQKCCEKLQDSKSKIMDIAFSMCTIVLSQYLHSEIFQPTLKDYFMLLILSLRIPSGRNNRMRRWMNGKFICLNCIMIGLPLCNPNNKLNSFVMNTVGIKFDQA